MVSKKRLSKDEANNEAFQSEVEKEINNEDSSLDQSPDQSLDQSPSDLEELENLEKNLETELGMEEVELDQSVIDTVAVDDIDDNLDDDEIYDDDEDEEVIDNRPQEFTESYGTGLQGKPSDRSGRFSRRGTHMLNEPEFTLTGGDVDANPDDANAVGEEAVGGTVATPDQDTVEELAAAVGIQTDDRSYLRTNDMLEQRDDRRWELDPESAQDYEDHQQ